MKIDKTYQGYKNRSTWLAILHIGNTSPEIYNLAVERAIQANTTKQFKSLITPILLECKQLWREQDFDSLQIDMRELWDYLTN